MNSQKHSLKEIPLNIQTPGAQAVLAVISRTDSDHETNKSKVWIAFGTSGRKNYIEYDPKEMKFDRPPSTSPDDVKALGQSINKAISCHL
jgi:hypothetical protein